MADYFSHLYIGKQAAGMERKIRKAVAKGRNIPGIHLITLASNGTDQLDILPLYYLKQKELRDRIPVIAGFANGREEALEIVSQMMTDAFLHTGKCDLRAWLPEADRSGILAELTENFAQEAGKGQEEEWQ